MHSLYDLTASGAGKKRLLPSPPTSVKMRLSKVVWLETGLSDVAGVGEGVVEVVWEVVFDNVESRVRVFMWARHEDSSAGGSMVGGGSGGSGGGGREAERPRGTDTWPGHRVTCQYLEIISIA